MNDFSQGYTEGILDGDSPDSLRPEAQESIYEDCLRFSTENKHFLLDNYLCKFHQAGRDFWFARNKIEHNLLTQFCNDYPPVQVFKRNGIIYL